uniref:Ran binding protein n=2 Tax=Solanum TaxID=4107 RepID=M1CZC5_SOLTU
METFQEVAESQTKKEENVDASNAAGLLEKLSVEDKKPEEKSEEKTEEKVKEDDVKEEKPSDNAEKKEEAASA